MQRALRHKAVLPPILVSATTTPKGKPDAGFTLSSAWSRLKSCLGGDNNLAVILTTYQPNIRCGVQDVFRGSPGCGEILAEMPASTGKMRFGPDGLPGVQEQLPQLFVTGELISRYYLECA